MKKVLVVVLMAVLVAGCNSTSEQRIAKYQDVLAQAQATSHEADLYIPQIDEAIASSEAAIKAGLPADEAEKILAKIDEARELKAKILAYKTAADSAATKAQAAIDTILAGGQTDFAAEMQVLGALLTSAGEVIPPPAGPFVTLGGILLGIIGGVIGGVRSQKKYKSGLVDVVKSIKVLIDGKPTDEAQEIKAVLKTTQSDSTRLLVDTIKMPKAA